MTTMFFAGIPLEGTGIRPLDADLYGAEGQNVDHENISATGNLNVGVVIQYDEHAAHALEGAAQDRAPTAIGQGDSPRALSFSIPVAEGSGAHSTSPGTGDNANLLQTATQSTPSSPSIELPTGSGRTSGFSPAASADAAPSSSGAPSTGSSSASSSHESSSTMSSSQQTAPNGDTTYNTTNNYENTSNTTNNYNYTENTTYNNTDNNYNGGGSLITIGNITINDNLPGIGHGGGIINNFTSIVTNEVNTINTVTDTTVNTVTNNILNNIDTTLTSITGHGGDIVSSVTNDIFNILNIGSGSTGAGGGGHGGGSSCDTLGNIVQLVDNTVDHLTGTVNNALSLTGGLTSETGGAVTGLLGGLVNDAAQLGNTTLSQTFNSANNIVTDANDLTHSASAPVMGLENSLSGNLSSVAGSLTQGGGGAANMLVSSGGSLVNDTLGTLDHGNPQGLVPDISSGLQTAAHDLAPTGGLDPANTLGGITHDVSGLPHDVSSATGMLSGALGSTASMIAPAGMPPIVDASISALAPSAPHASDALINVNGNVASSPQSTGNGGLVTVDASALSPGTNGFAGGNGASVAVTPGNVSHDPVTGSLSPQISIALPPAPGSVPIASDTGHAISTVSSVAHDTGSALDPAATLNALMQSHNVGVAVDSGVLFTGGGVSTGHDSSTSVPHDAMPVNHLLHTGLSGLHG